MSIIKYDGSASLVRLGKKSGNLKPDSEGYYTMAVGALNVPNSQGHFYTLEESAAHFESNSVLMKRVDGGQLFSEVGHPPLTPGMGEKDYVRRLLTVEDGNICSHIQGLWLDDELYKRPDNNLTKGQVAKMARIIPHGKQSKVAEESFSNKNINTAYSVRGFTKNIVKRNVLNRSFLQIITYDHVTAPGIATAEKWQSPSTESDHSFTSDIILDVANEIIHSEVATESSIVNATILADAIAAMEDQKQETVPAQDHVFMSW